MGLQKYPSTPIRLADAQHIGYGQQRSTLEDRCVARLMTTASGMELAVGIVADGIGGASAGEAASQIAIDTILNTLQSSSETDPIQMVEQAIQAAHRAVRENSRQNPRLRSMGTTTTLAVIHNRTLYLAHVGDSRAYLLRKGKLTQLTLDHTWGNENVRKGLLTLEEAKRHARREELARFIGMPNTPALEVDIGYRQDGGIDPAKNELRREGLPLEEGDVVLLCTDGLIKERRNGGGNYVEENEIISTLSRNEPKDAANTLLSYALGRQVDDNVSVVVLEVPGKKQVPLTAMLPVKWLMWGGLFAAAAVFLGVLFALFITPPPPPQTATATAQPALSPMPMVAGEPFVMAIQSTGASIIAGDQPARPLLANDRFGEAERTVIETNLGGFVELWFDDGSKLWLDQNTKIHLVRDAQQGILVEVERGRILSRSSSFKITDQGRQSWGWSNQGQPFEIQSEPLQGMFLISCLGSTGDCFFQSISTGQSLAIPAGQVGGIERGLPKPLLAVEPTSWERWHSLAPEVVLLPSPTPTLTATATLQPTSTLRPTSTKQPSRGTGSDTGGGGGGGGDGSGGGASDQ